MRVDPEVSRQKYQRELSRLQHQQSSLEKKGIFLTGRSEYPTVDLIFVPRHPLRVLVPAAQQGPILIPQRAAAIVETANLSARAFKARFDLSDYDLRAPSLEFRDLWNDSPLSYPTMFRALEYEKDRKAHLILLDDHPITHKPFLCLRGIREYHEHPQHSGDDWLLYRESLSLFSIIISVWRVCVDLIHPQLMVQVNGTQTIWYAEEKL